MTWSIDLTRRQSLPADSEWMTGNSPGIKRVSSLFSFVTDGIKRRYLLGSDPPVSRQNLVRVENAAIPLVPRIEKRAWTQVSVALRSAKVLFRRGPGHIRHTYIRMDK